MHKTTSGVCIVHFEHRVLYLSFYFLRGHFTNIIFCVMNTPEPLPLFFLQPTIKIAVQSKIICKEMREEKRKILICWQCNYTTSNLTGLPKHILRKTIFYFYCCFILQSTTHVQLLRRWSRGKQQQQFSSIIHLKR